jgi:hypothetical protein
MGNWLIGSRSFKGKWDVVTFEEERKPILSFETWDQFTGGGAS